MGYTGVGWGGDISSCRGRDEVRVSLVKTEDGMAIS